MEQEAKKISFGFSKLTRKPNLIPQPPPLKRDRIQLIDCLESQTIKLKNAVVEKKGPLVIPLPEASANILERRRELKLKRELKTEGDDDRPDSELTADELAARELIRDAQNLNGKSESGKIYALPIDTENVVEIEGKEESTLENYEAVPITQYGMAMLRGMGWKEGIAIGKNSKIVAKMKEPTLRPRGMGLGADKGANREDKPAVDKDGKELILKKGACAKITEGKQKGNYCEVQGFDENGRIIVKTTLQGLILSINELFVKPVTKEEYAKSSKVINNAKFEEYKIKTEIKEERKATSHSESNSHNNESNLRRDASTSRQRRISISSEDSDSGHKSRQKSNRNEKKEGRNEKREDKSEKREDKSEKREDRNGKKESRNEKREDRNEKKEARHKKKSKSRHRSPSYSSTASESERRRHKERARRSSSLSDGEHKKYKSKSKKKSKDKKDYRYKSDSDSGHSRSKDKYKKYKHKKH